jgi:hypothetical protein
MAFSAGVAGDLVATLQREGYIKRQGAGRPRVNMLHLARIVIAVFVCGPAENVGVWSVFRPGCAAGSCFGKLLFRS